jgi:hypothetical protein
MKKKINLLCLVLTGLLTLLPINSEAAPKQTKVYVFGISINFTDSVTYMTDIQILEPAYIETKTGFLYDRSIYSQQLQIWIEQAKKQPYTTCTIFFSENKSKLEKKYNKIRNKFRKDQSTTVKCLEPGEFKFNILEWTEHERL